MTQTEHLMASIVTASHDIAGLLARPDSVHTEGWRGAIETLRAERAQKQDLLAKLCRGWFE